MIEIRVGHRYLLRNGQVAICFFKVRNRDKYLLIVIGTTKVFYTRRYLGNTGDIELDVTEDLGVIK